MTRLSVWWDGRVVGTLARDIHGDMSFAYHDEWLAEEATLPISVSLPKRIEPFDRRATRYFFAGLLPEESQREGIARALGLSRTNDFALLDAIGGDVAGALSLWPEGTTPPSYPRGIAHEVLSHEALSDILDALPTRPLLAGRAGVRLSLAGAQSKLPVVLVNGEIALPSPGQPTTHILKPSMTRFPNSVENEALCMRLAKTLSLNVADVEARSALGHKFLLVERYDRRQLDDENYARIHQEDFCQALGIAPEHKYAAEGGPTFKTCFGLVRQVATRPAQDVLDLLDAGIVNVIIGNCDAHGKNFSLLYAGNQTQLAPLYDLMCTIAYPEVSTRMAMKIGDARSFDEIDARSWAKFAQDGGLSLPFVRRRLRDLTEACIAKMDTVVADLSSPDVNEEAVAKTGQLIVNRAKALIAA
jgi:serine/threonine-protein kinase HipA